MPRKRLTLADLVAAGTFDPTNWRHRRALDESGPLEDPELERTKHGRESTAPAAFGRRRRPPATLTLNLNRL
jgi:hypothetical protein